MEENKKQIRKELDSVNEYLAKQEQLNTLAQTEANKIATELISKGIGKSITTLRKSTLNFIQQNQVPDDISYRVKGIIDHFISELEIPTQN